MDTFDSLTQNDAMVVMFPDLASVIVKLLKYVYPAAGLLLLVTLVWGGITLMSAGGDANKIKEGYGKITAGLIGFVIIFVAYFLAQLVQIIFGVQFL